MNNNDTDWGLIKSWLDGDRSGETVQKLKEWSEEDPSNLALLKELENRWSEAGKTDFDSIHTFAQLHNRIHNKEKEVFLPRHNTSWIRVAAMVALIATAGFIAFWLMGPEAIKPKPVEYVMSQTSANQTARLSLPDGSVVHLNSGSTIQYPKTFGQETREVILSGEAFFEVMRDTQHPFRVRTGEVATTVLGTSFNIRTVEGPEVTVSTGKVKVSHLASGQSVLLMPGEQALQNGSGGFEKREVNHLIYSSWKDDVLVLDEFSLADAAIMLGRKYNVIIDVNNPKLGNCIMVGEYQDRSLENILLSLQYVLDFEYEFTSPKAISITGEGCKE